ncbi:hypothetical protein LCGC14_2485760, partial [marine sediment metagenome]
MSVRVEHGDCREILGNMEPDSVQCCITSPPYFGLRDYKLKPLVWGGKVDCGHEWGCERRVKRSGGTQASTLGEASGGHAISDAARVASIERSFHKGSLGQFCRNCGAWRGQLGLEPTPEIYVAHIVECFRAVKRVLRADGVLWLNMGDSYASSPPGTKRPSASESSTLHGIKSEKYRATLDAGRGTKRDTSKIPGLKPKDLLLMPFEVAKALRADGWWLRSDIIWSKPNPMPESVTDRPTQAHEHVFLFAKSARYFYDAEAVRERAIGCNAHDLTGQGYAAPGQTQQKGNRGGREKGRTRGLPPRHSQYDSSTRESLDDVGRGTGRNLRNVWEIATAPFPKAHFATFPTKLVEPMVKAGTSEKGCCPECGGPWVREIKNPQPPSAMRNRGDETKMAFHSRQLGGGQALQDWYDAHPAETTGWHPSCKCAGNGAGEPIPCTILDPSPVPEPSRLSPTAWA